jgi:hypothetical protein
MDYRQYDKEPESKGTHPAWRGIGCLLMMIIPVISFAAADLILRYARGNVAGFFVPFQLRGNVSIPGYGVVVDLWAVLLLAFVIALVLFAVLAIVNSLVYGMSGMTRRRFEAPPPRYKPKRKRR